MKTNKKISIFDCYTIFKKYGDLNLNVNGEYGFHKINGCEITAPNSKYVDFCFSFHSIIFTISINNTIRFGKFSIIPVIYESRITILQPAFSFD